MTKAEDKATFGKWTPIKPDRLPPAVRIVIQAKDTVGDLEGRIFSPVVWAEADPWEQYKYEGGLWYRRIVSAPPFSIGGEADEAKDYPTQVVIGNEAFLKKADLFGRRLMPTDRVGIFRDRQGREYRRFVKATAAGQLTFAFLKDTITGPSDKDITPSVHAGVRRLFITLIGFTEKKPIGERQGTATIGDILDVWGEKKPSGTHYEMIERYFMSLGTGGVSFDNRRRGSERIRWGFNFMETYAIVGGMGRNTRLIWQFTPTALSRITELWIKGELTSEKAAELGGFVAYPSRYLREPLPQHLDNIRCALLTHRFGRAVTMKTILRDWAKVKPDQLRRPDESVKLGKKYLTQLEKRGIIGPPKIIYASKAGQLRKGREHPPPDQVKVIFTKPGKASAKLSPSDQRRFHEIFEWLTRKDPITGGNIHGTTTRPGRIKEQLERAVNRFGMTKVFKAYENHGKGASPSPVGFWDELYPRGRRGRRPKTAY